MQNDCNHWKYPQSVLFKQLLHEAFLKARFTRHISSSYLYLSYFQNVSKAVFFGYLFKTSFVLCIFFTACMIRETVISDLDDKHPDVTQLLRTLVLWNYHLLWLWCHLWYYQSAQPKLNSELIFKTRCSRVVTVFWVT